MTIQEQLRKAVEKLRRTPMPIASVIPLLTKAADTIDALQAAQPASEPPTVKESLSVVNQSLTTQPLTPAQRVDIADACAELDFDDSFMGDVGKIIDLVEAAHNIRSKPNERTKI
jgi:hypothetical protein